MHSKVMVTDKLDLQSPDIVNENFERLATLFPNCVTESDNGKVIDFELLKQELNHAVVEGNKERYRLEWPGKKEAIVMANLPTTKTLRPVREDSVDFDNTGNLYIEGDNLEVLKLLQESYLGKIKMIYIDPPYNTGKDFVYKDNFTGDKEDALFESGQQDEYNQRLVANPDTAGRYHSDWLTMIFPRLKLARNLLCESGVILISIDDHEIHNLRKLCDDAFGEVNFIASLVWEKGRKNDSRFFSQGHEYIIVFAKNKEYLKQVDIRWREEKPGAKEIQEEYLRLSKIYRSDYSSIQTELKKFYTNLPSDHPSKKHSRYSKVDERGVWRDDNMSLPRGGARYEVLHPITRKPCAIPPGGWRYATIETMNEKIREGYVVFREDHTEPPIRKTYLIRGGASDNNQITEDEEEDETSELGSQVIGTYFYRSGLQATNEIQQLFRQQKIFNNPKDHEVLARLIDYCTNRDPNAIILDFFGGAASAAHAVFHLNANDSGFRKFIQVQIPEETIEKSQAFIAGYKNICEIGKERIRRAAVKIKEDTSANIDYGFRVYRLADSNMQDVYYKPQDYKQEALDLFADNVKSDRTADDLLAQVMLDWGLSLSLTIVQEAIAGKQVFKVAENSLYACFDKGIDEAFARKIAKDKPLRIVFRDNGFKDDTAKTNVKQLLKQLSPETEMKVI
jgi:adenine-specific DNA-methyltransferase